MATALGAGVVVGAGLAYVISRVNEHTHLTQQISSLHETILQVRRDLASLETGKFDHICCIKVHVGSHVCFCCLYSLFMFIIHVNVCLWRAFNWVISLSCCIFHFIEIITSPSFLMINIALLVYHI